jgi:hypothetical protein
VECHAGDIAGVALKFEQGRRICGAYVEKLDGMVAGGGKEALIGRDA